MKRIIKAIWDYFRPSWEGNDNKFSYKRASQFVFLHLMVVLAYRGVANEWEFKTFLVLAIIFSLVAGIMTVAELILMIKYYSKKERFDYFNADSHTDTESVDALSSAVNDKIDEQTDSDGNTGK